MDRSSKRKMGRLYRGAFLLGLALIGISSTAFGAFVTTGGGVGDAINVNPGEVTVAGIVNPRDYINQHSISATPYCDDGFVTDQTIVFSGTITYSFYIRSSYGGTQLSSVFPNGFDLELTITISSTASGNLSDYFSLSLNSTGNSNLGSPTLTSSGNVFTISSSNLPTPTSATDYAVSLNIAALSSYSSIDTFTTAATYLDSSSWRIDATMR